MSFQENGCDFPLSFHLVNKKSNHGKVEPSGRRVEMKGQFNLISDFEMELKLIEVNCDGMRFGITRHFYTLSIALKGREISSGPEVIKKV